MNSFKLSLLSLLCFVQTQLFPAAALRRVLTAQPAGAVASLARASRPAIRTAVRNVAKSSTTNPILERTATFIGSSTLVAGSYYLQEKHNLQEKHIEGLVKKVKSIDFYFCSKCNREIDDLLKDQERINEILVNMDKMLSTGYLYNEDAYDFVLKLMGKNVDCTELDSVVFSHLLINHYKADNMFYLAAFYKAKLTAEQWHILLKKSSYDKFPGDRDTFETILSHEGIPQEIRDVISDHLKALPLPEKTWSEWFWGKLGY